MFEGKEEKKTKEKKSWKSLLKSWMLCLVKLYQSIKVHNNIFPAFSEELLEEKKKWNVHVIFA